MQAFILLAVLPLVIADQGSFVRISGFGQNFGYNHGDVHYEAPKSAPHPTYKPEPVYKAKPEPVYHAKPEPKYHPKPAPAYHAKPTPAYGHHAPAYGHPAPKYGHHAPSYGGYGYEKPKHNCSVEDVVEYAEVCTPTIETSCEDVELPIKRVVDKEFCYTVTRTVCTESIEKIPQEVCTYSYQKKYQDTTAKTVEVEFKRETNVQMVTVCQPGHGYGQPAHGYGHHGYGYGSYGKYCKEVEQETAYNVPVVNPVSVGVKVSYPDPIKTCIDKPISLPRVSCEDLSEEKCIMVPEIMEDIETVEKCQAKLGAPKCQNVSLTLPKQVCVELVYGYAHEKAPYHH